MASLMGGSRQTETAAFPPDRFFCLLDELPLHLVPQSARQLLQAKDGSLPTLVLNPECKLLPAQELPGELCEGDLCSGFALRGTIAWVRNWVSRALLPFWLGNTFQAVLQRLSPGEPVPHSVPGATRALLAAAEILVPEGSATTSSKRDKLLPNSCEQFQQKGYVPIPSLIHPFQVAALRRYYRYQIRTGAMRLGDRQSPLRYGAYNEPVARFFHHQMTPIISELAGQPLKPSYVYLASYLQGAELKKHSDREQCDFSVTLCLDYSPEPALASPWPIKLETPRGTVTVYQALGDGLAYRGMQLPHYRDTLGEGQTSTSVFFHYVSENFVGSLE
jgi:hypothetical protein